MLARHHRAGADSAGRRAAQKSDLVSFPFRKKRWLIATSLALILAAHSPLALSQQPQRGSVGRGWPVPVTEFGYVGGGLEGEGQQAAWDGQVPDGAVPLERDLFTTKDFYQDRALWSDPRYFRCNSPSTLQAMWGADLDHGARHDRHRAAGQRFVGALRDRLSARGDRVAVSVQDRAGALRGAARRDDGERRPDGLHAHESAARLERPLQPRDLARSSWRRAPAKRTKRPPRLAEPPQWFFTSINQTSTILSLLTPEYQQRTVQMHYHQSVDNAPLWPAQFCWPDGFMRLFSRQAHLAMDFVTTPERVQLMASSADNFIRHFNVGREFDMSGNVPRLGADVPRWFGESVAFWDGDTLVTWTSNVIPWITHGVFEFSGQLQTIEIFSPRRDPNGELAGIEHEIVLYDPEAFVQPLRLIQVHIRTGRARRGRSVHLRALHPDDLSRRRPPQAAQPRAPRSSTRCRTSTAGRGRRSGRSTSSRACSDRDRRIDLRLLAVTGRAASPCGATWFHLDTLRSSIAASPASIPRIA